MPLSEGLAIVPDRMVKVVLRFDEPDDHLEEPVHEIKSDPCAHSG